MIKDLRNDSLVLRRANVTGVHVYAHRYPVENPTMTDGMRWHEMVLLEWDHGQFTTVIELAWLNGISGYSGKSNFVEDKLEPVTVLSTVLPKEMQLPWDNSKSEIRIIDMAATTKEEFEIFLNKW